MIHSVDRLSLISALGKAMQKLQRAVPCFIQVNIGAEAQKGGCSVAELPDLLKAAQESDIPVEGLMCIPPAEVEAAPFFALFDMIHSVDRLSLISALGKAMQKLQRAVPCFIQVNIGAEAQKGGCSVAELPELLKAAQESDIPVAGLMCIPPADVEAAPFFALLAELSARYGLPQLSMGMSDDFETAIMLGTTHIRLGTALFGERTRAV